MSEAVTPSQGKRIQESQFKEHLQKMKQMRQEFDLGYRKEVNSNEKTMESLRKDYDVKVSGLKSELEKKLNDIRQKHTERMRDEGTRLESELVDLRKAHEEKKNRLIESQTDALHDMEENHTNYVDNAKRKQQERISRFEK